jgi:hypothetical protein
LLEHLWSLLQFLHRHQAACAASTKLVITPSSDVMPHLLYVKLDFQKFPIKCTMQKDLSKVGSHVVVKLNNVDLPLLNVSLHFGVVADGVLLYAPISISFSLPSKMSVP